MRLARLTFRGFRNLRDAVLETPARGLCLLGANGQGKTSLLEAIYFPVLFRSFRTSDDSQLARFGGEGFAVQLSFEARGQNRELAATYRLAGRRKRLELDGLPIGRAADAIGTWRAVSFLPDDVRLASGPAAGRREFIDRTLALSDAGYLAALTRYRHALAQRNSALRAGRADLARAFDKPLAGAGARVVAGRSTWITGQQSAYRDELTALGDESDSALCYGGNLTLADEAAWGEELARVAGRDEVRGATTIGPHRDDLELLHGGRPLREFGSTGQQRCAAIALKLLELSTMAGATGELPALLLDDVFAELDRERQEALTRRLLQSDGAQVFLTAPRPEEMPAGLGLELWRVADGEVRR